MSTLFKVIFVKDATWNNSLSSPFNPKTIKKGTIVLAECDNNGLFKFTTKNNPHLTEFLPEIIYWINNGKARRMTPAEIICERLNNSSS